MCEIVHSSSRPLSLHGSSLIGRCLDDCLQRGLIAARDSVIVTHEVDIPVAGVVDDDPRAGNVGAIERWLAEHGIAFTGSRGAWETGRCQCAGSPPVGVRHGRRVARSATHARARRCGDATPRTTPAGTRTSRAAGDGGDARSTFRATSTTCTVTIAGKDVRLTNLRKPFWPERGITKGDLLRYYADVAPALLPHLRDRAMVMKRYPNGADGEFFFMKRAPAPRPDWIETCAITHGSGNVIDFPIVQDLPSLLWVVNLGCIDLNPWYARCDDVDRPDYLHFDLDPVPGADFRATCARRRCSCATRWRPRHAALRQDHRLARASTSTCRSCAGRRRRRCGRSPRRSRSALAQLHPELITAEYRIAKRPRGPRAGRLQPERVGPHARLGLFAAAAAARDVSTPRHVGRDRAAASTIEDFRIDNMPARIARSSAICGRRCWRTRGRFDLAPLLE